MFIKMRHHITDVILVVNVDVESYKDFFVSGSRLMFTQYTRSPVEDEDGNVIKDELGKDVTDNDRVSFPFKSQTEAEFARDSLFMTLGTNSPFNKTLDLTLDREDVILEKEVVEVKDEKVEETVEITEE